MKPTISLNRDQQEMLNGSRGVAKQMAMRLVLDLAATAGASELIPIRSAHLSGVSPLTGGLGLRRFLANLARDSKAQVAVPTTLNAAGCDAQQFEAMRIAEPGFLARSLEIVDLYTRLGVRPTQSCIPYEWDGVVTEGHAAWAESNAICFGNSYCGLMTNRESGLSALASALTGYTPKYGLLLAEARYPNLIINVTCRLDDPTDFSILGDWIGKQRQPHWMMPYGPIPLIKGLPSKLTHEQRKALTAAAANYGSPLLYLEELTELEPTGGSIPTLTFTDDDLERRYSALGPRTPISLITIGCPQASVGEIRSVAELLQGKKVRSEPGTADETPPLWVFTASANMAIAEQLGLAQIIRQSGALLLENTCPEVVPYDQRWVKHILTNSMKAEHYIKSGLNGIPTSVMRLRDCVMVATGDWTAGEYVPPEAVEDQTSLSKGTIGSLSQRETGVKKAEGRSRSLARIESGFSSRGHGLPSQGNFTITGEAFVTPMPITLLGFVNRETGVVEEEGHQADGKSMAGKIAIFPKGTGSTVAPYVLLELYYRGKAPIAIVNTEIDQQSAPACSLEGIPYAYDFDRDIIERVQDGDIVELKRVGEIVTLRVLRRV